MPSFSMFPLGRRRRPNLNSDGTPTELSALPIDKKQADLSLWPFPAWTRYTFEAFLGKGAMGEVYRVFDPVLNRSVALKILSHGAMIHADRFLSEARAMARVDHPNVAKVFEAGEVEGRPYLTMQLLHGESLHALQGKLGLEERVEMMRQACEGVQAAHRMGLLHRDIKPGNIVLEKDADDLWHAFVVDFGLACNIGVLEEEAIGPQAYQDLAQSREYASMEAPTATSAGNITGTPAFMSPEQAAGDPLDTRSDVFSLGSTFYAVLTGSPPFSGQSILSILGNVALSRPVPLQDFGGKFPQDLEAIVQKAMEKDPLRRYPSARAMAMDLERWLNGEAVEAMERKRLYRMGCWIKKHRITVGLGALVALSLLGVLGLGLRASWRARAQARYYQYFCQEAERMETKILLAEAKLLHDTLSERQAVEAQMKHLEQAMVRAGSVGEAPGCYALGRGHLILGKWTQARQSLEKAWKLGLQTPEVASALGYCLNQIYASGLAGLSGPAKQERKAVLDAELKPWILNYLALARQGAQGPDMDFVEAQLAMTEGRYQEAQAKADRLLQDDPWHVRALLLKVNICMIHGDGLVIGQRPREQAKQLLNRAREIARSSSRVFEKQAQVHQADLMEAIYQGKPFMGHFNQVLEAARRAQRANSQSAEAWGIEASTWCCIGDPSARWYWSSRKNPNEYQEAMQRAIVCAEQALTLDPESRSAMNTKGIALWYLANWRSPNGLNAQGDLDQAIGVFSKLTTRPSPSAQVYMNLGACYAIRGGRQKAQGCSPLADYQKALENFSIREKYQLDSTIQLNLAQLNQEMGEILWWQAQPVEVSMRNALAYARRVLTGPQSSNGHLILARIYLKMAEQAAWFGKIDNESLNLGADHARQAMAVKTRAYDGLLLRIKAMLLSSFTGAGNCDFKTAKGFIKQIGNAKQGLEDTLFYSAWLSLELHRKNPSWRAFLALETQIHQALKESGAQPELHLLAFEACRVALEKHAPGATPDQWRARMVEHIQAAKRMNPLISPLADKLLKERAGIRQ